MVVHNWCQRDQLYTISGVDQNKNHLKRFGFQWLTEITVTEHFLAEAKDTQIHQDKYTKSTTQDSSLDSLEELMRGNVDITVPSIH